MTNETLITLVISLISLLLALFSIVITLISTLAARKQADQAEKDVTLSHQIAKGDAIFHFTDRFFGLLKDCTGNIEDMLLQDRGWSDQYWSLQATEFYFFHHGILPEFMYSLWMLDLAELYASERGEAIRQAHLAYMRSYSLNYQQMAEFYEALYQFAKKYPQTEARNQAINTWIANWIAKNRQVNLR